MKRLLKISCLVIIFVLGSCITAKGTDDKAVNDTKNDSQSISSEKMQKDGFIKGTLTTNKSSDCPYILTVEKYTDKLDPINIQDFFKNNIPEKVWVKYSSLRMNSRCNDARPVSITEISARTD
ncbi:hypothetical protein [Aquimarina sp. 2201CG14-23]|uniref:hypothetical protein n=1 Tax=Aquimarina mycalae TaxID=3040073 RepID=UPI0024781BD6|nr:hypothetical protein [Aquimarina sp. 2201CG14-23]MDH7446148.1 hypothetical protein [Aquimarina sp. 2201CG14-23]